MQCLLGKKCLKKKRKPSATVSTSEGVVKKPKTEGDVVKVTTDSPKLYQKEGDVKEETNPETKPSVTLDKTKVWMSMFLSAVGILLISIVYKV